MALSSNSSISLGGVSGTVISGEGHASSVGNNNDNLRDRQNQLVWELALQIIKLVTTTSCATSCSNVQSRNETLIRLMINLLSETLAASITPTSQATTTATTASNNLVLSPQFDVNAVPSSQQRQQQHNVVQGFQTITSSSIQGGGSVTTSSSSGIHSAVAAQAQPQQQQGIGANQQAFLASLAHMLQGSNVNTATVTSISRCSAVQPVAAADPQQQQKSVNSFQPQQQQTFNTFQPQQQPQGGDLQQTLMASLVQMMGPNAGQKLPPNALQQQQQQAQPQQPQAQGGDLQQNVLASLAQFLGPNATQQRQQQGSSTSSSSNSGPLNGGAFPKEHQLPQQHAIREVNIANAAYPMTNIEFPGPHDVVLGRGRGASSHIGNIYFRAFIKHYKRKYSAANRIDKPKVAGEVVAQWRKKDPPGRFLMQVGTTDRNLWHDVGDRKARQKTSQSLRERECLRKKRRRSKLNDPRGTTGSSSSAGSSCASDDEGGDEEEDDDFSSMATTGSQLQKKRPAAPVSAESETSSGASATVSGSDSTTATDNATGSDNCSGSG